MKLMRVVSILMCVMVLVTSTSQSYGAEKREGIKGLSKYDKKLIETGTPRSVVDAMNDNFKQFICENMEENESYEYYDSELLSNKSAESNQGISTLALNGLSTDEIQVNVYAVKVLKDGKNYIKIYPSFEWKKAVAIKNDTFAFSLYSGWSCKADENPKLIVKSYNGSNKVIQAKSFSPTDASENGYGFQIPSNYGIIALPQNGHYEGYTYFYAEKTKKAKNSISIKYVHDSTSKCNVSYGISIGIGNISVSNNSNKLCVYAANKTITYSTK